jgi:large subunit ribosomal protein L4
MIDVSVYNKEGQQVESLKVDELLLGGTVRYPLLKQAIVMYHANRRVGTAATKGRSMVAGSTRKLFRQKGTGRARAGTVRTGKRVGGGATFFKIPRDFGKRMPKKQKHLARDSAVLAKLLDNSVFVIDELKFDKPRTREFVTVLNNLKIDRSCLITTDSVDANLYKSARNVPKTTVMPVAQLNAGDICNHRTVLFTKEAFLSFIKRDEASGN